VAERRGGRGPPGLYKALRTDWISRFFLFAAFWARCSPQSWGRVTLQVFAQVIWFFSLLCRAPDVEFPVSFVLDQPVTSPPQRFFFPLKLLGRPLVCVTRGPFFLSPIFPEARRDLHSALAPLLCLRYRGKRSFSLSSRSPPLSRWTGAVGVAKDRFLFLPFRRYAYAPVGHLSWFLPLPCPQILGPVFFFLCFFFVFAPVHG